MVVYKGTTHCAFDLRPSRLSAGTLPRFRRYRPGIRATKSLNRYLLRDRAIQEGNTGTATPARVHVKHVLSGLHNGTRSI